MTRDEQDGLAIEWITKRVESLSALPAQSACCAYTHRRTPFIVFANGCVKPEGQLATYVVGADVLELADLTLAAVRNHRAEINGPALLTWRRLPEVSRENGNTVVSCRLVFEPDIWA